LNSSPTLAGLFIGGTIHDVAQVVGAGHTLGPEAGDIATIVKLFRVAMLAVFVLALSLAFRTAREQAAHGPAAARQPLVPWFLWLFAAIVMLHSIGSQTAPVQQASGWGSRAGLVPVIAALGTKTGFMPLAQAGWRPIVLILVETLWVAALVLGTIVWRMAHPAPLYWRAVAGVAQLVEQRIRNAKVGSSTLLTGTNIDGG
jgi:uncharacterized membrane protein YadS